MTECRHVLAPTSMEFRCRDSRDGNHFCIEDDAHRRLHTCPCGVMWNDPASNGCTCPVFVPDGCEHTVQCPVYEPPLTYAELRALRAVLAYREGSSDQ